MIWGSLASEQGHHALLLYPVHNRTEKTTEDQVVAALVADVSWDDFMSGVFDAGAPDEVSFVLGNSCGQQIVYTSANNVRVVRGLVDFGALP